MDHAMQYTTASCTPAMSLTLFLFHLPAGLPGCEPGHVPDPPSTRLLRRSPNLAGPFSPAIRLTCGLSPGTHQTSPSRRSEPPGITNGAARLRHASPATPDGRQEWLGEGLAVPPFPPWWPGRVGPSRLGVADVVRSRAGSVLSALANAALYSRTPALSACWLAVTNCCS